MLSPHLLTVTLVGHCSLQANLFLDTVAETNLLIEFCIRGHDKLDRGTRIILIGFSLHMAYTCAADMCLYTNSSHEGHELVHACLQTL